MPPVKNFLIGGAWLLAAGFGITYRVYPFWRDSPKLFFGWGAFYLINAGVTRNIKNASVSSGMVLLGAPMVVWIATLAWKIFSIASEPTSLTGAAFWIFTCGILWGCRSKLRQFINQLRWRLNRHRFEADFRAAAALDLTGGRSTSVLHEPSEHPEITAAKLNSLLTSSYTVSLPTRDYLLSAAGSNSLDEAALTSKRKNIQRQMSYIHGKRIPHQVVQLTVDRDRLVAHSLHALRQFPVSDLVRNRLEVRFEKEYADDLGGVTRDWMDSLGQAVGKLMFSPPDSTMPYVPLGLSSLDGPDALDLVTVGRLMALCVLHATHMRLALHPVVCNLMVGLRVTVQDLFAVREAFYQGFILKVLEAQPESIQEAAGIVGEEQLFFVCPETGKPLVEGGVTKPVTVENCQEYVCALASLMEEELATSEIGLLLAGFWEVIPQNVLVAADLSGQELSELITGNQQIDVGDWRAHTEYSQGCSSCCKQVEWFWSIMSESENAFRMKVLQFTTGSGSLPIGGSQMLQPRFTISKDPTESHLPQAHACANQLVLPMCNSQEEIRSKLELACEHGCGFGFI